MIQCNKQYAPRIIECTSDFVITGDNGKKEAKHDQALYDRTTARSSTRKKAKFMRNLALLSNKNAEISDAILRKHGALSRHDSWQHILELAFPVSDNPIDDNTNFSRRLYVIRHPENLDKKQEFDIIEEMSRRTKVSRLYTADVSEWIALSWEGEVESWAYFVQEPVVGEATHCVQSEFDPFFMHSVRDANPDEEFFIDYRQLFSPEATRILAQAGGDEVVDEWGMSEYYRIGKLSGIEEDQHTGIVQSINFDNGFPRSVEISIYKGSSIPQVCQYIGILYPWIERDDWMFDFFQEKVKRDQPIPCINIIARGGSPFEHIHANLVMQFY